MKRWMKIALATATMMVGVPTALVFVRENRKFDAPYPDNRASSDPAVIERGKYLVYGPGHCADCHGDGDRYADVKKGVQLPLSGGLTFHLPFGEFHVPNITPDKETGIGRYSDAELARILRHGVRPDGRAVLPFMPFANLSEADLTAVISFLRTQEPVKHAVPKHEPNFVGRALKAFVLKPVGPSAPVMKESPTGPTIENGKYLTVVGNCVVCHSKIDPVSGKPEGAIFSGGNPMESHVDPTKTFTPPNLTPHPTDGWITGWSEDAFVNRLGAGIVHPASPMPWHAIQKMSDDDRRAIYRYLRSLPPAPGGPSPIKRDNVASVQ